MRTTCLAVPSSSKISKLWKSFLPFIFGNKFYRESNQIQATEFWFQWNQEALILDRWALLLLLVPRPGWEMGLCFWDGPAPRASVSTLSFFRLLFSHKLPDFEGLAGAQEGFTDPWVCPSCRLSVVSGDDAAWRVNQPSRTSRRPDTGGPGCCLWSDTMNSHSWCPWSQEPPRLVCRPALLMCFESLFPF